MRKKWKFRNLHVQDAQLDYLYGLENEYFYLLLIYDEEDVYTKQNYNQNRIDCRTMI